MVYDTILYGVTDGIAKITLNRPDNLNALTTQMRAELADAIKTGSKEGRVVVLTGAGRGFCAGQDLGDRANAADVDLERTLRDEYEPLLRAIYDAPVPVMAAVNGVAAGAGANIALAADVVIATESAKFLQAFAKIGLIPDAGGTYWMPRQMGFAKAMGAALFAEPITARQADDWGLIWEAVADDVFETHWRARAATLASGPTAAYAAAKQAIRASMESSLDAQLAFEAKLQGQCGKTRDFQEGVTAFLEKRTPSYEGR